MKFKTNNNLKKLKNKKKKKNEKNNPLQLLRYNSFDQVSANFCFLGILKNIFLLQ